MSTRFPRFIELDYLSHMRHCGLTNNIHKPLTLFAKVKARNSSVFKDGILRLSERLKRSWAKAVKYREEVSAGGAPLRKGSGQPAIAMQDKK